MPELKLNDETVARLQVETGREDYYDSGVQFSFGVRVTAHAKTWFTRYVINRRHRRLTLGSFPVVKHQEAFWKASEAQVKARQGIDPAQERQERRQGMTVDALAARYLELIKPGDNYRQGMRRRNVVCPGAWTHYMGTIKNHVLPAFGKMAVHDVRRRDLFMKQEEIAKKYPGAALNFHKAVRNLFLLAEDMEELRGYNPIYRLPRPAPCRRYPRRAFSPKEIQQIWQSLESRKTSVSYALRMLLLTGQRPSEVRTMRWRDLQPSVLDAFGMEVEGPWWTVPITKNGAPQAVYLGPTAQKLLADLRVEQKQESEFVFPGQTSTHPVSEFTFLVATLRELHPDFAYWCPHCCRHTFTTWAHKQKIEQYVIMAMLNHRRRGATPLYDHHDYLAERKQGWTQYDAYIQRCLSGEYRV